MSSSGVELPCDGGGTCMICKKKPPTEETLTCKTCATPWHALCLSTPPTTMADAVHWECPDCTSMSMINPVILGVPEASAKMVAAIQAIESNHTLTDQEKNKRRQQILSGGMSSSSSSLGAKDGDSSRTKERIKGDSDLLDILNGKLNCSICMQLPERPITTPCGHNFCLRCFQKWIGQGKSTCVNCRRRIPSKVARQPRINSTLVFAIRMATMASSSKSTAAAASSRAYNKQLRNQNRPDKAFTTERAKKGGKANAASGIVFVTVPSDHFGPILAEHDPTRNLGVLVGESWVDRLDCRQWGLHLPVVAGIAGQAKHGAQSVVLSGGYEDDEDHGEWFLYTGSGGKDLSGNKRTNKEHSFDQQFRKFNEALRVSCKNGYPVRVLRSHKEKRSAYAPANGLRYDGIYRIEKCWFKNGIQGFRVCRFLFVRCDNQPAPWTSDDHGDLPRPLPAIDELNNATNLTERTQSPSWDYDEEKRCWTWKRPPPPSRGAGGTKLKKRKRGRLSIKERLLKEFGCQICLKVMSNPLTTPCGHNFCKECLEGAFAGQSYVRERGNSRRTLRAKKNVMKCPSCAYDIADFLQNPQVNGQLKDIIESLQQKTAEMESSQDLSEDSSGTDEETDEEADEEADEETDEEADEETDEETDDSEDTEEFYGKDQAETKPQQQQIYKQKGINGGNQESTIEGGNGRTLPKVPGAVNGEKEGGTEDNEMSEIKELPANAKPRLSHKRKKADDAGTKQTVTNGGRTRGKRSKTTAA